MAHPAYGAKNCRGAGSEAVAATRMEYSKAFASERIWTNCATVELLDFALDKEKKALCLGVD